MAERTGGSKQTAAGFAGSVPYFDAVAPEYFDRYREQSPGGHALRERKARVLELLGNPPGRVLDIGCGPGVLVRDLLDRGLEVWGLDASPAMIAQCRTRFRELPGAHFTVGDASRLHFPDGFFDVVMCIGALDRIHAYAAAVSEMTRVVRQGGIVLISFPNLLSPYASWKNFAFYPVASLLRHTVRMFARRPHPPALPRSLARLQTPWRARVLLAAQAVRVTDVVYFHFNPFLSPLDEVLRGRALQVVDRLERLRFGRLRWFGAGFIVKGRKL